MREHPEWVMLTLAVHEGGHRRRPVRRAGGTRVPRGVAQLSMVAEDREVLVLTGHRFDGAIDYFRRKLILGRDPS